MTITTLYRKTQQIGQVAVTFTVGRIERDDPKVREEAQTGASRNGEAVEQANKK